MPNLVGWMKISFILVLSCIVRVSEEDILCRLGSGSERVEGVILVESASSFVAMS
jgi:hypothetical protein